MKQPHSYQAYTAYTIEQLVTELDTSIDKGLCQPEVERRLQHYGPNELPQQENSWWLLLLRQFTSPFIYLLLIVSAVALVIGDFSSAIIIFACVLLNTLVGFYQEYKAQQSLQLLKEFLTSKITALRDGKEQEIPTNELVPGDILLLYPGDIIPADVRFVKEDHVHIDESILTGESGLMNKQAAPLEQQAQNISDAYNIGFSGTTIMSGKGVAVVIATGVRGALGKIAALTAQTQRASGFSAEIARFGHFILGLISVTVALVFIAHLLINFSHVDIINLAIFCIALGVTIIPEALPAVTAFGFTRGALRLAQHKVVVKRLSAIEDLGSIEILCTDKTGTLTENKLTIAAIYGNKQEVLLWAALGSGLSLRHLSVAKGFDAVVWLALTDHERLLLQEYQKVNEIPFDPKRRRSLAIYQYKDTHELVVRGSATEVLAICTLDEAKKQEITQWVQQEGSKGHRVIAIARKQFCPLSNNILNAKEQEHGMALVGLIAFEDPLKKSAIHAIEKAHQLGVQIKIITGDSPEVGAAIAQKVGLIQNPAQVITGDYFATQPYDVKKRLVENAGAFARITPEQKYEIIQLLQEKYKVGYMGDGINDAPALKVANVALAVDDAADIARDAADIILLQRSLSVIINGIEEGRIILVNTLKYMKITLAAGFGHFYALAIASLLIDSLPMLPSQLLVLNFLTDIPLIALSTDTISEAEITAPQKYNIKDTIIMATLMGLVITTFDFILFGLFYRNLPIVLQTNWFISCILNELAFALSMRSSVPFYNAKAPSKILLFLLLLVAVVTIALPYTFFGQKWLHFMPPSMKDLMIMVALAICCFIITECVKMVYSLFYKSS